MADEKQEKQLTWLQERFKVIDLQTGKYDEEATNKKILALQAYELYKKGYITYNPETANGLSPEQWREAQEKALKDAGLTENDYLEYALNLVGSDIDTEKAGNILSSVKTGIDNVVNAASSKTKWQEDYAKIEGKVKQGQDSANKALSEFLNKQKDLLAAAKLQNNKTFANVASLTTPPKTQTPAIRNAMGVGAVLLQYDTSQMYTGMAKHGAKLLTKKYLLNLKRRKYEAGGPLGSMLGAMGGGGGGGAGGFMSQIGGAMDSISNSIQTPQEQGKYGNITKGMDAAYDAVDQVASLFPPVGSIVSGAMKVNKLFGKVASKVGGGTDGMTKADSILGSAFFQMTPLGLINGFGGLNSHTLNDLSDLTKMLYGEQALSGFNGTLDATGKTMAYSNKKYGLFSNKARKKANKVIDRLNILQSQMQDIAATASDAFDTQIGMSGVNEAATGLDLAGGYQQGAVHTGKKGMKIEKVFNQKVDYSTVFSFKGGGKTPDKKEEVPSWLEYDEKTGYYKTGRYADERKIRKYFKEMEKNPKYKEFFKKYSYLEMGSDYDDEIFYVPKNIKDKIFQERKQKERLSEGNGGSGGGFSNEFDKRFYNGDLEETGEFSPGGLMIYRSISDGGTYVRNPETASFKVGGLLNVIPEGHLHARLHHMEGAEDLTKKGIPVVDNEGNQQAEIELNEIIFNKEVTVKLEELWKKGTDLAAIEAGKLLATEIIENTDDRTGLIDTIK